MVPTASQMDPSLTAAYTTTDRGQHGVRILYRHNPCVHDVSGDIQLLTSSFVHLALVQVVAMLYQIYNDHISHKSVQKLRFKHAFEDLFHDAYQDKGKSEGVK